MYSIVLMAALTTGVDVPDMGRRGGCCGGGCYGSCYGSCYGCCGGGCYGGGRHHGRHGGCYGCQGYSCCGCYGGVVTTSCYGCYGGGVIMPPVAPEKIPAKPKEKTSLVPAAATIVVDLPADAKLLIDDRTTTSVGANRVFQSPILNPGKTYSYTFTAEIVREGKPVRVEQVVEVSAGETTPVRLILPATSVAQR